MVILQVPTCEHACGREAAFQHGSARQQGTPRDAVLMQERYRSLARCHLKYYNAPGWLIASQNWLCVDE